MLKLRKIDTCNIRTIELIDMVENQNTLITITIMFALGFANRAASPMTARFAYD